MSKLSGPIFEITLDDVPRCRVWVSPDVDAETGAVCARDMVDALCDRVLDPGSPHRGVIFDVRDGPPAFGPKTQAALTRMLDRAVSSGRHVSLLVGDSAIQRMQFERLSREAGDAHSRVFSDDEAAARYAKTGG